MDINEFIPTQLSIIPTSISPAKIKPGEIWAVRQDVQSPLVFNPEEQQRLYPETARTWQGESSNSPTSLPRYVTIVREPEDPEADPDDRWQEVSVMLMSVECDRPSNVDILIPGHISGVGQDLLAETWNVTSMLTCNLSHRVGQRLSRQLYDLLLDIGDAYHGLLEQPPTISDIERVGLQVGTKLAESDPDVRAFHQQETDWAAVLEVPVAAYRTYRNALEVSEELLDIAIDLERAFPSVKPTVILSEWLDNTAERIQGGWQLLGELMQSRTPAGAFRKMPNTSPTQVSRGISIDFENQGQIEPLILAVLLQPTSQDLKIIVRLYPTGDRSYLPPNIQMILCDESGNSLQKTMHKSSEEPYIQIKFNGVPGEEFGVKVNFAGQSILETFVI